MNIILNKFDENFLNSINFIHEVKVYNEIQNDRKVILFDLRKQEDFKKHNLDQSINIPFNEFEESFFETIDEKAISELTQDQELRNNILKYKRFYIVIIISQTKISRKNIFFQNSQDDEELEIIQKSLIFYKAFIKNRVREIGLYNPGFTNICKIYPFLIRSELAPSLAQYLYY
jgi:rhodanese-related sulfurtransferase